MSLPSESDEVEELAAVHRFLSMVAGDRAAGRERSEAEYVARFPGHAAAIASEHRQLSGGGVADCVGPYQLISELGRGGQATVWLAQDTRLPRRVALKVLRRGPASRAAELRLRREAEAIARLDDSGVCAIHEIGQDHDQAWIAMRYVPGETLAARLEARRARGEPRGPQPDQLAAVVAQFQSIAASLHRAHTAGIVHRDLKPQNVMLGEDDRPVVLDFGLACGAADDASLTLTGDVLGTPAYMAPEQVAGRARHADARTDVYALGVMLYEALTLRRPFAGPTRELLYQQILRGEPVPPRRHAPSLSRDLDLVVRTAMAREPAHRYQTASDLAEDLRRVGAGQPILARPPGWARRAREFVRRHRLATATGAALAVGLVATLLQAARAERARERAERQTAVTRAVNDFMVSVFARANPWVTQQARSLTAQDLLAIARDSVAAAFPEQQESKAAVHLMLGLAGMALGDNALSGEQLEAALELRRTLPELETRDLVEVLLHLAYLRMTVGDYAAAERDLAEAARLAGWPSPLPGPQYVTWLRFRGCLESFRRNPVAAVPHLQAALAAARAGGAEPRLEYELATDLARAQTQAGLLDEAQATLTWLQAHADQAPDAAARAGVHEIAANLALGRGAHADAIAGYEAAQAAFATIYGEGTDRSVSMLMNLGVAHRRAGNADQALRTARRAHELARRLHGERHAMTITAMRNLAIAQAAAGDTTASVAMLREALAALAATAGADSREHAECRWDLAAALLAAGDTSVARAELVAERDRCRAGAMVHAASGYCLYELARQLLRAGDAGEAAACAEEACRAFDATPGQGRYACATRILLAEARLALPDPAPAQAESAAREAYDLAAALGEGGRELARSAAAVAAAACQRDGRTRESAAWGERASR
jgi:hypothetical protein